MASVAKYLFDLFKGPAKEAAKKQTKKKVKGRAVGGKARSSGVGKRDLETGRLVPNKDRPKQALKNAGTRTKRAAKANEGKLAAGTVATGTAAILSRDDKKVTQASPKRLKDIKMESPKPKKKAAPKPKPKAEAKKPVKNKDWVDPDTGKKASESKVDSGRGVLRDSSGKPVRSGSGSVIRTNDFSKMTQEEIDREYNFAKGGAVMKTCAGCKTPTACKAAGKCLAKGYSKGGAVRKKKPTGYMCGGAVKKKMAKGGAVKKSKPKGCGCAKRGYGKAMK